MEDLYGTTPASGTGLTSEAEDITNILNQLLQSSSSSSPSSSSSFTAFKTKYAHLLHSPPPQPTPQHHPATPFSDAGATSGLFGSEDRLRFGRSGNPGQPVEASSGAGSSGFRFSDPTGGYFGAEAKDGAENAFSDANTSVKGRRISPENDLGDFSCDSEGPEASDVPSNSAQPPRSSSKRSRAAEVHNLSEKRRRSRINEKMKALQNLIPNSNKTDKASMLDEAIEYLKQLQLQVQMLTMRNGLNLHPMCLPGVLQPMQLPLPQTGLGFNEGTKFPNPGIGISPCSSHEVTTMQSPYDLSNSCTISNQPVVLPSVANVAPSDAPLGFEQSTQTHFRPVNLPASSTEICDDGKQQVHSDNLSSKSPDI